MLCCIYQITWSQYVNEQFQKLKFVIQLNSYNISIYDVCVQTILINEVKRQ